MIRLETRTVYACRCARCGWEWDADAKPDRCARCKVRTWNGEDDRFEDPHDPRRSPWARGTVPVQIETGQSPPPPPSFTAMLISFIAAREMISQSVSDSAERAKVLASIERHIRKLEAFVAEKKLAASV